MCGLRQHVYLVDYACEYMPHNPSLEGAAYFLATGKYDADDDNDYFAGGDHTPAHGEIFKAEISTEVWAGNAEYKSACPDHHWAVETFGPNLGWSPDDIYENIEEAIANGEKDSWYVALTNKSVLLRLDLSNPSAPTLKAIS